MVHLGKTTILTLTVLLIIGLATAGFVLLANGVLLWNVQTVDGNAYGYGNAYCQMVLDSHNTPHITYTDVNAFWNLQYYQLALVMYASWNGTGFSTQKVADGSAYSLILDNNDNPHILYLYSSDVYTGLQGLMYASWTGTNWTSQTVDANGGYGVLGLDSFSNPHVAYISQQAVKYASWTGSGWDIQTIDNYTTGIEPAMISFALDSNNTAYIMYAYDSTYHDYNTGFDYRSQTIRIAKSDDSGWNIQNVSLPSPIGSLGNIVIDSKNIPHFTFSHFNFVSAEDKRWKDTLLYASWNGHAWTTQAITTEVDEGMTSDIALDLHDNPHIITSSGIYATLTGKTWDIQNAGFSTNKPCSMTFDSNGNPHISYIASSPTFVTTLNYASANRTFSIVSALPLLAWSDSSYRGSGRHIYLCF